MKVLLLSTWNSPVSEERQKKWVEFDRKIFYERNDKHNVKTSHWTDGSGEYVYLMEFESYEHYAKWMDDEDIQNYVVEVFRYVDNVKFRVLREVF